MYELTSASMRTSMKSGFIQTMHLIQSDPDDFVHPRRIRLGWR
jgi:hypothetical protein